MCLVEVCGLLEKLYWYMSVLIIYIRLARHKIFIVDRWVSSLVSNNLEREPIYPSGQLMVRINSPIITPYATEKMDYLLSKINLTVYQKVVQLLLKMMD